MARLDPARWQEVQPLLDEVLDHPAAERERILDRIRAARPDLARLVEDLLATDGGELPTLEGVGLAGILRVPPSLDGQAVGAYTLERLLGEGGMGNVWLARRSDGAFEGAAAIKLLHLGTLGPGRAERFQREATLLSRLDHPNIARLLDAGVTPAGQPYLVLEHVDGVRLDRHCAERRLPLEERLRLFAQVCAAVSAAHRALIVHRDIKPANVLVAAGGRVKLLDFGIAKLVEDSTPGPDAQTTHALTPEFASPEQVREAPVTTAADVYGLGLLLHLLLTGRHPTGYDSRTPADFLQTTLDRDPMRASEAVLPSPGWPPAEAARHAATFGLAPGGLRRLLRGDLDVIIARALRKEPAERYASAAELADDIERHLTHQPVRARPESAWYLARKYLRRHRVLVGAAGLIVATLLGATWVTTRQMLEAERERDEARVQRDRARFEEQRAAASSGFMQTLLASMAPSGERLGTGELLDRARAVLEAEYAEDPRFVARMMLELAEHYESLIDMASRRAVLERAIEFARRSGDPETLALAECSFAQYLALVEPSRLPEAREQVTRAAGRLGGLPAAGGRTRVRCLLAGARVAGLERRGDSADGLAEAAVTLLRESADTNSLWYAGAHRELAFHHTMQGRDREALASARRMVATLERIGRGHTLQAMEARRAEFSLLDGLGERRLSDSLRSEWLQDVGGLGARMAAHVELERIWQAEFRRQPEVAVALLRGKLARMRKAANPMGVKYTLMDLTPNLVDAEDVAGARRALAEVRDFGEPADSVRLHLLAGRVAEGAGDLAGARQSYGRGLAALGFPHHPLEGVGGSSMLYFFRGFVIRAGNVALAAGDPVAADSLARHFLRMITDRGHDPSRSGEVGRGRLLLAEVRLALGDSAAGLGYLRGALLPLAQGLGPDHPATRKAESLLVAAGR